MVKLSQVEKLCLFEFKKKLFKIALGYNSRFRSRRNRIMKSPDL